VKRRNLALRDNTKPILSSYSDLTGFFV